MNTQTNTNLPTITNYGQYSSDNYGVNSLRVSFPLGLELYYSYETIVAFSGRDGLKVRQNDWSTTTGKHLNWIDGGEKKSRLNSETFENMLIEELDFHGLADIKTQHEI